MTKQPQEKECIFNKKQCRNIFCKLKDGGYFLDNHMCFASLWDYFQSYLTSDRQRVIEEIEGIIGEDEKCSDTVLDKKRLDSVVRNQFRNQIKLQIKKEIL